MPRKADIVKISYNDLVAACSNNKHDKSVNIDNLIEQAFGVGSTTSSSLGIIAITNIPTLTKLRSNLLPLAPKLATLPPHQLEQVTAPQSQYQVGWSHGREKLEGDKLDFSKGSYYANPLTDDLVESLLERRRCYLQLGDESHDDDDKKKRMTNELQKWDQSLQSIETEEELRQLANANPAFFAPNVWPTESLPELEGAFKEMGRLIHQVGVYLAKCCDLYVAARCPGYNPNTLENVLVHSKCCKARLLHYFATEEDDDDDASDSSSHKDGNIDENGGGSNAFDDTQFSTWCGWHNDHGSLTGLVPAMYHDRNGNIVPCPDENAGLYIKSRSGELVHVQLPENALAFQVGETAQVHTGGWLHATPHAVRGCKKKGDGISRSTFAVFMEPEYHSSMDLPVGRSVADVQCEEAEKSLPKSVRTLKSRWKQGNNFGMFSNATFAAFH